MVVTRGRVRIEDDLVGAALAGEGAALDRVVAAWLPQVYAWCARLGAPRVDPEEAAHDVLMLLVRRHATIDGPSRLPAWLFGTCRRVVANHRRRAWIRRWLPGATPDELPSPATADGPLEERELARRVAQVLEGLPAAHREVLVLCYLEDRSVQEAAELLGIPPGTVKSRLFAARARFQAHFPEDP